MEVLDDAERLLTYSAEIGREVDDQTRDSILKARTEVRWNKEITVGLLNALTWLSAKLYPVNADSLACSWDMCSKDYRYKQVKKQVKRYLWVAVCLAAAIIPLSMLSFVASTLSATISKDIKTANGLAVTLTTSFWNSPTQQAITTSPPTVGSTAASNTAFTQNVAEAEKATELQSFAAAVRSIESRARQLDRWNWPHEPDPYAEVRTGSTAYQNLFQLKPMTPGNLGEQTNNMIVVYQEVRSFAESVIDDVQVRYGAVTMCILPVLYALLGACAYLLRSYEQEVQKRTLVPSRADAPRFLIAAIGGAVVGLFNFTIPQQASIPQLAIAFLIGYAVDVFYSFLEGLLQSFTRSKRPEKSPVPEADSAQPA